MENGDLSWIVPGKLAAFSGPAARPSDYVGFRAMVPEDYWGYYHRRRVTAVVRLNKKVCWQAPPRTSGLQPQALPQRRPALPTPYLSLT